MIATFTPASKEGKKAPVTVVGAHCDSTNMLPFLRSYVVASTFCQACTHLAADFLFLPVLEQMMVSRPDQHSLRFCADLLVLCFSDGSGTVTTLEAFRALLVSGYIPETPLQFMWFSAEEGGLLGSQAISQKLAADGVSVKAMVQMEYVSLLS